MEYPRSSMISTHVIPTEQLDVEHTRRCLMNHGARIIECPPALVRYLPNIEYTLWIVKVPESGPLFVDDNGWAFSISVIQSLVKNKKLLNSRA